MGEGKLKRGTLSSFTCVKNSVSGREIMLLQNLVDVQNLVWQICPFALYPSLSFCNLALSLIRQHHPRELTFSLSGMKGMWELWTDALQYSRSPATCYVNFSSIMLLHVILNFKFMAIYLFHSLIS